MIESLIEKLIASIDANTEAVKASAGAVTTTAATKSDAEAEKPAKTEKAAAPKAEKAAKPTKPTKTQAEVNSALIKLKDTHGAEEAKAIVANVGGVAKMAEIPEAKYDAVYEAAVKRFEELNDSSEGDDDEGDGI